jgi:hypothetical protein
LQINDRVGRINELVYVAARHFFASGSCTGMTLQASLHDRVRLFVIRFGKLDISIGCWSCTATSSLEVSSEGCASKKFCLASSKAMSLDRRLNLKDNRASSSALDSTECPLLCLRRCCWKDSTANRARRWCIRRFLSTGSFTLPVCSEVCLFRSSVLGRQWTVTILANATRFWKLFVGIVGWSWSVAIVLLVGNAVNDFCNWLKRIVALYWKLCALTNRIKKEQSMRKREPFHWRVLMWRRRGYW